MTGLATLSNEKNYTVFRYGDHVIRFAAPYSLEHYTEVKEWDNGYLVVMAKYKQNQNPEEEYIFFDSWSKRRNFRCSHALDTWNSRKYINAIIFGKWKDEYRIDAHCIRRNDTTPKTSCCCNAQKQGKTF